MLELKEYQQRVLGRFEAYLKQVNTHRKKKKAVDALDMGIPYDIPARAWEGTGLQRSYLSWQNGLGQDIPSLCFKVPTGGGKTLLAVHSLELLNLHYELIQTFAARTWRRLIIAKAIW